jgi:hypothetical protein
MSAISTLTTNECRGNTFIKIGCLYTDTAITSYVRGRNALNKAAWEYGILRWTPPIDRKMKAWS